MQRSVPDSRVDVIDHVASPLDVLNGFFFFQASSPSECAAPRRPAVIRRVRIERNVTAGRADADDEGKVDRDDRAIDPPQTDRVTTQGRDGS